MNNVNVSVIGLGTVGGAFVTGFPRFSAGMKKNTGVNVKLNAVCDIDPGKRSICGDIIFTDDYSEAVNAGDIIVEAAGGTDSAFPMLELAVRSGKPYVTANKAMLAEKARGILNSENTALVAYEAAVGGGMPLINTVKKISALEDIIKFRAVLNGTANFVLTKMWEGKTFQWALEEAKCSGFAEADPSLDLNGTDTGHKLALMIHAVTGTLPEWGSFHISGMDRNTEEVNKQKLVAAADFRDSKFDVSVCTVAESDIFYHCDNEENCAEIIASETGRIVIRGPGAGGRPTAMALFSDLADMVMK